MGIYITRNEAAELSQTTPQTISNWYSQGLIRAFFKQGKEGRKRLMVDKVSLLSMKGKLGEINSIEKRIENKTIELRMTEENLDKELRELGLGNSYLFAGLQERTLQTIYRAWMNTYRWVLEDWQINILTDYFDGVPLLQMAEKYQKSVQKIKHIILHATWAVLNQSLKHSQVFSEREQLREENDCLKKTNAILMSKMRIATIPPHQRDIAKMKILQADPKDLKLSTRLTNLMGANKGIHTMADVVRHTPGELLSYKGFGTRCLREVQTFLNNHDLQLGMDVESLQLRIGTHIP